MLGIHSKTLHHWLKEANLPLAAHPRDARIKCVAQEHLQEVARLHGRPLQASQLLDAVSPSLVPSQAQAPHVPENGVEPSSTAYGSETDLTQKLARLEIKMVTLQEQLAQLALALLKERERSVHI